LRIVGINFRKGISGKYSGVFSLGFALFNLIDVKYMQMWMKPIEAATSISQRL